MARQIGLFFLFIGVVVLAIFFASDQTDNPVWGYFIAGVILAVLGVALMSRNRRSDSEPGRFKTYRKLRNRSKGPK